MGYAGRIQNKTRGKRVCGRFHRSKRARSHPCSPPSCAPDGANGVGGGSPSQRTSAVMETMEEPRSRDVLRPKPPPGRHSLFSLMQHSGCTVWHKKFGVAALLAYKSVAVVSREVVTTVCQVFHNIATLASAEMAEVATPKSVPHTVEGMDRQDGRWRSQAGSLVDERNRRCNRLPRTRTDRGPPNQTTFVTAAQLLARTFGWARVVHHVDSRAPCAPLHLHRRNPHRDW